MKRRIWQFRGRCQFVKCLIIHELSSKDIKAITSRAAVEVNDHIEASADPFYRKLDIAFRAILELI